MRIGVNLLWVRPGKNGGTESYIHNILDGICEVKESNLDEYYLYVSPNNEKSFEIYKKYEWITLRECNVDTEIQYKRILWENLHLGLYGKKDLIDVWFMPVYSRPLYVGGIPSITTIHDLQGLHYPEYFSFVRNFTFRLFWWWDCHFSKKIVTISNFCKEDILEHYKICPDKIEVIYNPILVTQNPIRFAYIEEKYGISPKKYIYTVSALAKHKNLITLLKALKLLAEDGISITLVITGVKVNASNEIIDYVNNNNLQDNVIFTGYIANEERDCLYKNCSMFVFPSVFEGFGMPPIEAMLHGVPVITTKKTSLYEVTQGNAIYVENPYDEQQWKEKMEQAMQQDSIIHYKFEEYELRHVVKKYIQLFNNVGQCE